MLGDHEQFAIAEILDARREAVAEEVEQGENALDRARRVGRVLLDLQRTIVMQEAIKDVGRAFWRRPTLRPDRGASRLSVGPDPAQPEHDAARDPGAPDRQLPMRPG